MMTFEGRGRKKFKDTLEENRAASASAVWAKARLASQLRHIVIGKSSHRSVAILSEIKIQNIIRALKLAPESVRLTIDDKYQIGLCSVIWRNAERLHVPDPGTYMVRRRPQVNPGA